MRAAGKMAAILSLWFPAIALGQARTLSLRDLPPGTPMRLQANQRLFQGALMQVTADSVALESACTSGCDLQVRRVWALEDITWMEYRRGSHAGRGFLVGFGVGAAMGLAALAPQENSEDFNKATAIPLGMALLGVAGGLLGAVVGGNQDTWAAVSFRF